MVGTRSTPRLQLARHPLLQIHTSYVYTSHPADPHFICMYTSHPADPHALYIYISSCRSTRHIYIYIILQIHTPNFVDVLEGVLTFLFFPVRPPASPPHPLTTTNTPRLPTSPPRRLASSPPRRALDVPCDCPTSHTLQPR